MVNAKITAPDFAVPLEKGRKKPALFGRAKTVLTDREGRVDDPPLRMGRTVTARGGGVISFADHTPFRPACGGPPSLEGRHAPPSGRRRRGHALALQMGRAVKGGSMTLPYGCGGPPSLEGRHAPPSGRRRRGRALALHGDGSSSWAPMPTPPAGPVRIFGNREPVFHKL